MFVLTCKYYITLHLGDCMSSSRGLTQEEIWKACDTVFAEGKPVTNERVRAVLKRGSYSTIGEHIKAWKERPEAETLVKEYPMPDWAKKMGEEYIQSWWNNFNGRWHLITDNETIAELEKENESLRDKLALAQQVSIRHEDAKEYIKKLEEQVENFIKQQRLDVIEITRLQGEVKNLQFFQQMNKSSSNKGLNNAE